MNSVNKTLYIPLYGKALVSQKNVILQDKKAEEIWAAQTLPLKRKSRSKWLAYYTAMRAAVFDEWTKAQLGEEKDCLVLHLGCGLDSRVLRVNASVPWIDVDFAAVLDERRRYYTENEFYQMISADLTEENWINTLPMAECAVVILEGVSMYLPLASLQKLIENLAKRYPKTRIFIDCYSTFAAKMSKIKNPVKEVGVSTVYGLDDPKLLEVASLKFIKEHAITPTHLIDQLSGLEKKIFKWLYAGKLAKKLYRLYEFSS